MGSEAVFLRRAIRAPSVSLPAADLSTAPEHRGCPLKLEYASCKPVIYTVEDAGRFVRSIDSGKANTTAAFFQMSTLENKHDKAISVCIRPRGDNPFETDTEKLTYTINKINKHSFYVLSYAKINA
ncbi:MAG: hypothetical protein J0H18_18070 [Rhizobiales bacterium]|nr:hypothetical protein [Hyphomicrobiales bacterium]